MLKLTLLAVLGEIFAKTPNIQYVYPTVRNGENLCFSGEGHGTSLDHDAEVEYSIQDEFGNLVTGIVCKVFKNQYMGNGDFMPLSMQGMRFHMIHFLMKIRHSKLYKIINLIKFIKCHLKL